MGSSKRLGKAWGVGLRFVSSYMGSWEGAGLLGSFSLFMLPGFAWGLFSARNQRASDSCNDKFNKCKILVSFLALNRYLETNFSQAGVGKRLFKETGEIKVYFLNDKVCVIAAITLQPKGWFEFNFCFCYTELQCSVGEIWRILISPWLKSLLVFWLGAWVVGYLQALAEHGCQLSSYYVWQRRSCLQMSRCQCNTSHAKLFLALSRALFRLEALTPCSGSLGVGAFLHPRVGSGPTASSPGVTWAWVSGLLVGKAGRSPSAVVLGSSPASSQVCSTLR